MNGPNQPKEAILEAALALPPEQRGLYLQQACGEDSALRKEIEELLAAHHEAGSFMSSAPGTAETMKLALPVEERTGTVIGSYKILERLGEGGFGAVYVAEQREPVKRRVALKIIKLGMDTRQVVARFEAEKQALAMMDHPNIAKVLDAGTTEKGRPYFVMELVRGIKLTEYCDQNNLSTSERLELLIKVCQAIQHAHQKGIIHRDIKPSNILVTLHDGVAVPKVIDFGIAKATQGELTDKTVYTQLHQVIGTPAYMSPEQAEMSGLDVDTRSDIYSLGVLLYEILTGRTPFDQKKLLEAGLDEMRRIIREQEPMRPSTRISSLQEQERTTAARQRGVDAPRLAHLLRGDLDWIVMKCLEKDRARRYETANGLAMDLQRYLRDDPVVARPPSKLYRLQKTVRRNKLAFAAATAVGLAVIVGAVLSTWQAVRARRAELTARKERDTAQAINLFLTDDLLFQATPDASAPEAVRDMMKAVLDKAESMLAKDPELARQPEVEATLRLDLGRTFSKLSLLDEAKANLRRAVELRKRALGPRHPDTLAAANELGRLLVEGTRDYAEGERVISETFLAREQFLGAENRDTLDSMTLYVEALAQQPEHWAEAADLAQRCFELKERTLGPDNYQTIEAMDVVMLLLTLEGRYARAIEVVQDQLKRIDRAGFGDRDEAMWASNNLSWALLLHGDATNAEIELKRTLPRAIHFFGTNHLVTLHLQRQLARVLDEEGNLEEAQAHARAILALHLQMMPNSESTGRLLLVLGRVLVEQNNTDQAKDFLQQALDIFSNRYSMKPYLRWQAENWLGVIEYSHGAYSQAEELMKPGADEFLLRPNEMTTKERQAVVAHMVELYERWGKPQEAAVWREKLESLKQGVQDTQA